MENEKNLNQVMQLIKPSRVTVLGGLPGSGNTALALNLAVQHRLYDGGRVAIFSIEMPTHQMMERLVSLDSGIELRKIVEEEYSSEDCKRILSTRQKIAQSNLFIDDSSKVMVRDIIHKCERFIEECGGLDLVIIDYLQLIFSENEMLSSSSNKRTDILTIVLNELDDFAKRVDIPILILSQLIRADRYNQAEKEMHGSVTISRYSGFKGTWLILRRDKDSNEAEIYCAQGEHKGESIPLIFDEQFLKFSEE